MKKLTFLLAVAFLLVPSFTINARADEDDSTSSKVVDAAESGSAVESDSGSDAKRAKVKDAKDEEGHSFLVGTLLYIPNRILDIFDIFRFRVRVGPGIAAGARVTQAASLYAGTYATVYAGLPGPRMRQTPKLPIGLESHSGATVSVVDATVDGGIGPDYSPTEVGGGLQLLIFGFDIGIDPVEIADFATGILTIDLRDDDL